MCTATWWHTENGYDVLFNRDELKTRLPEIAPQVQEMEGVRYVAPCDADKGGTWLWVNEYGMTLGLLNFYPQKVCAPRHPPVSRGLLVRSLARCKTVVEVQQQVAAWDLSHLMPYTLFAVARRDSCVLAWDTQTLCEVSHAAELLPLTSSSYATEQVEAARKHLFMDMTIAVDDAVRPARLRQFHNTAFPGQDGAYGVCMERDDARTVSVCWVRVRWGQVASLEYMRRAAEHDGFEDSEFCHLPLC